MTVRKVSSSMSGLALILSLFATSASAEEAKPLVIHHVIHHHPVIRNEPARAAAKAPARRDSGWSVSPGEDLHDVMSGWARSAGWTLVWQSDFSYQIAGHARFSGDFIDATGALMSGMQEARPAPAAEIYRENRVIVIKDGLTANR